MPYLQKLKNGLTLVGETLPYMRSVCLGLWIPVGSLHETVQENGISHFIEHMVFKGTQRRTSQDIAEEMDGVGGALNAFTTKEATCLYARVVDAHLPLAVDMLMDMALSSQMDAQELDRERDVVLEEIAMVEDTPEDLAFDLLGGAYFGEKPLAKTILGTEENLKALDRDKVMTYYRRHYRLDRMVMAVVGGCSQEDMAALLENWQDEAGQEVPAPLATDAFAHDAPGIVIRTKPIEQVHLCVAYPGISHASEESYALAVLNNILGGGMSSRLFQEIREKAGLAYSVYSYPHAYAGCGVFTLYAGLNSGHLEETLFLLRQQTYAIVQGAFSQEELHRAKEQLKGNYILGRESTTSRMNSLGRNTLLGLATKTEEEILQKVDAVTHQDVQNLAVRLLNPALAAMTLVGPGEEAAYRKLLENFRK